MDDPGLAWPAWKFGMKRGDLFTKLHDQYNTVPSAIQDPEAFHHDVYEISHEARTPDEFHSMMAARKDQRLRELNDSLESASLEIIANPSLIGTEQWQYAVQLFRTKSLDSLVRYFASYLPGEHPWHRSDADDSGVDSDASDSIANSMHSSLFEEKPLHHEPFSLPTAAQLPPSPRSMTMSSDESVDMAHHYVNTLTPARTLSFSESESDRFGLKDSCPHLDDTSQSSEPETPVSSVGDLSESQHHDDFVFVAAETSVEVVYTDDSPTPSKQVPSDVETSETPTPKPDALVAAGGCFFAATLSSPARHRRDRDRSASPSRGAFPLVAAAFKDCRKSPRLQRRDLSPLGKRRGRSTAHRVQKTTLPDPTRSRPRGRRRADGGGVAGGC